MKAEEFYEVWIKENPHLIHDKIAFAEAYAKQVIQERKAEIIEEFKEGMIDDDYHEIQKITLNELINKINKNP
jgi:hypothetical protein